MGWARNAWMAVALLAFAAGNAAAAEPKRVLLLHSFGWNFQAEDTFAGYLRTDLAEKSPFPLDRYEVSLEIARFTDGERDEAFVSYLRAVFADHPPDLIVTMISPAARFIQRHRRDLFASTPVIFAGLDPRTIKDTTLTANDTMVAVSIDLNAIIGNILLTLPNTTTLAVVMGDAPIEKFWVNEFLLALRPFEGRVKPVFMNDLSFSEIQKQVATLPPASAIYFGDLVIDAQGVPSRQGGSRSAACGRQRADIRTVRLSARRRHRGGATPLCSRLDSKDRRGRRQFLGELRPAISRPRRRNLGSLSLTGGSCGDGEHDRQIRPPAARLDSGSRRCGSNTGGIFLQPRPSRCFRGSLSLVCCSTGCGCGGRMTSCGQAKRA